MPNLGRNILKYMRKIVISCANNDLVCLVTRRLQDKFYKDLVVSQNEITRILALSEYPDLQKEYKYCFGTDDVHMLKLDEAYFFQLALVKDDVERLLAIVKELYDDHTHWRYFIVNADGNPTKTVANILNYDFGPVPSNVHLPGENYEFIP